MKQAKLFKMSEEMLNKIIATAYGDANFINRLRVYWEAKRNPEIKKLLDEHKLIANEVHKLEPEECPQELIQNLEKAKMPIPRKPNSFISDFIGIILNRPLASTIVTVVVVSSIIVAVVINRPNSQLYSEEQIKLADQQAKYALQILGNIMSETEQTLKNEILSDRVSKPIREGLEIVNTLLNKEK
jgi:hypothetical protein